MKAFEGWSEARIKAYKMIGINPNTYYYRFNAPGEKQRNGAWTPVSFFFNIYIYIFLFFKLLLWFLLMKNIKKFFFFINYKLN